MQSLQKLPLYVKLFTMMNIQDNTSEELFLLGLSRDEARVYTELLRNPTTHLKLAHATGINRTTIYRLVDKLEKLSLVTKHSDDRGTFLTAADPTTLEVELVTQEEKLKQKRIAFRDLLPKLEYIKTNESGAFIMHTYNGEQGLKQMLWHELKTKGELLILGCATVEQLVADRRWSERYRGLIVGANYQMRELMNTRPEDKPPITGEPNYMHRYQHRLVPSETLILDHQTTVYNNTVAIYHWHEGQKVGVEIVNRAYAQMMRQIFEQYWQFGKPGEATLVRTQAI
jgi:DNA-binding MarR family transcriptional regulator